MSKRAVILLAAVALAAAGVTTIGAVAVAQEATPATPSNPVGEIVEQLWDKVAEKLGVKRAELDKAVSEAQEEVSQEVAKRGRMSAAEAERLLKGWSSGRGLRPMLGRGPCGEGLAWAVRQLDLVAEVLGMKREELEAELKAGKSLDEIAKARGMEAEEFHKALAKTQIQAAVKEGRISQEQADWLIEGIEKGYPAMKFLGRVFGAGPCGPGGRGMRGMHRWGGGLFSERFRGWQGEAPSATPEQQSNPSPARAGRSL